MAIRAPDGANKLLKYYDYFDDDNANIVIPGGIFVDDNGNIDSKNNNADYANIYTRRT